MILTTRNLEGDQSCQFLSLEPRKNKIPCVVRLGNNGPEGKAFHAKGVLQCDPMNEKQ